MSQIQIVRAGHSSFAEYWNELMGAVDGNPQYFEDFTAFFASATGDIVTYDFSRVEIFNNRPIAGVRVHLAQKRDGGEALNYFGLPGYWIADEGSPLLEAAQSAIEESAASDGLRATIERSNVEISLSLGMPWVKRPSKTIRAILQGVDQITPSFDLYLDLNRALPRWPKSVRAAQKNADAVGLVTKVVDFESGVVECERGMRGLKAMHYASAGRLTRPDESWKIQLDNLLAGKAFLALAEKSGEIIGGSYFIRTGKSSYYDTSVVEAEHRGLGLGHVCMLEAIGYAKGAQLGSFWIGSQFSQSTIGCSEKQNQIEHFKSYFGKELDVCILASRQPENSVGTA